MKALIPFSPYVVVTLSIFMMAVLMKGFVLLMYDMNRWLLMRQMVMLVKQAN